MKKLLLLASILLTTLSSFSQIDTNQTLPPLNNLADDSLICIPKTLGLYVIRDLIDLDFYKQETLYMNGILIKQSKFIAKQDSMLTIMRNKEAICQNDLTTSGLIVKEQNIKIDNLQKDLVKKTKAKRFWFTTTLVAAASAVLVHLSWKGDL